MKANFNVELRDIKDNFFECKARFFFICLFVGHTLQRSELTSGFVLTPGKTQGIL